MNVEFPIQTADTTLSGNVSINLLWDHAGEFPNRSGAPEKFHAASGAVFRILLYAQDPPSLHSLFFSFHYRSNITNANTLSAMDFSAPRPTKRFGLLKKQKDESVERSLASVKTPSSSMFRIMVNFVKEGPTASENYKTTDPLLDEETEAPMPRRKTQYEIFLKHKVREAQVSTDTSHGYDGEKTNQLLQIRSYNDEIERESRLSRSSSCFSGHSTDTIPSARHVRFADDV